MITTGLRSGAPGPVRADSPVEPGIGSGAGSHVAGATRVARAAGAAAVRAALDGDQGFVTVLANIVSPEPGVPTGEARICGTGAPGVPEAAIAQPGWALQLQLPIQAPPLQAAPLGEAWGGDDPDGSSVGPDGSPGGPAVETDAALSGQALMATVIETAEGVPVTVVVTAAGGIAAAPSVTAAGGITAVTAAGGGQPARIAGGGQARPLGQAAGSSAGQAGDAAVPESGVTRSDPGAGVSITRPVLASAPSSEAVPRSSPVTTTGGSGAHLSQGLARPDGLGVPAANAIGVESPPGQRPAGTVSAPSAMGRGAETTSGGAPGANVASSPIPAEPANGGGDVALTVTPSAPAGIGSPGGVARADGARAVRGAAADQVTPSDPAASGTSIVDAAAASAVQPAPAPASGVMAETAPPAQAQTPASQVAAYLTPLRRGPDGTHRLTVDLYPEDLGHIKVVAEVKGGEIAVRLAGSTEAGRQALATALPELRKDLIDSGFGGCSLDLATDQSWGSPDQRNSSLGHAMADRRDGGAGDRGAPDRGSADEPARPRGEIDPHRSGSVSPAGGDRSGRRGLDVRA